MNYSPTISPELQEAQKTLSSNDQKVKANGMRQVMTLFGQGENCIFVHNNVALLDSNENITLKRFKNIINQTYIIANPDYQSNVIASILLDYENSNPQIKALAVRMAGSITNNETSGKLIPLIQSASQSDDPYIRKAASISILKIYQNSPVLLTRFKELVTILKNLLEDPNPNVAANAICALTEINNARAVREPLIEISLDTIIKLLTILEDATEWAQIQILDYICDFSPPPSPECALDIIRRIATRLIHVNPGLTMAAVRCCLKMSMFTNDMEQTRSIFSKIMPPLVSLLNNNYEIQYTVLKSITVILQKYKRIFADSVNIFYCRYNDPLYIKLEKLDIILSLANDRNTPNILSELTKYAHEEEIRFVRKTIRIIGKLALVFESIASTCVDHIVGLLQSKTRYVIQECIIISVNILRRYPNQFDNVIAVICQHFYNALDDHRAKAAMAWILGEYSGMITNAAEHMDALFLDDFLDEPTDVQLSILTAVVKFYLNNPEDGQEMLKSVLTLATNESDNPDLKDHALLYMCLLSECPNYAMDVVMAPDLHEINSDIQLIEPPLVDVLFPLIGSLSVIYRQYPQEFVPALRHRPVQARSESHQNQQQQQDITTVQQQTTQQQQINQQQQNQYQNQMEQQTTTSPKRIINIEADVNVDQNYPQILPIESFGQINLSNQKQQAQPYIDESALQQQLQKANALEEEEEEQSSSSSSSSDSDSDSDKENSGSGSGSSSESATSSSDKTPLLVKARESNYFVEIRGSFDALQNQRLFVFKLTNYGEESITVSKIELNKNLFSLALDTSSFHTVTIQPKETTQDFVYPVVFDEQSYNELQDSDLMQFTVKVDRPDKLHFSCPIDLPSIFVTAEEGGKMSKMEFMNHFKTVDESSTLTDNIDDIEMDTIEKAQQNFPSQRIYFIARKGNEGFFTAKTTNGHRLVLIFEFLGNCKCDVTIRMENLAVGSVILAIIAKYLMQ